MGACGRKKGGGAKEPRKKIRWQKNSGQKKTTENKMLKKRVSPWTAFFL